LALVRGQGREGQGQIAGRLLGVGGGRHGGGGQRGDDQGVERRHGDLLLQGWTRRRIAASLKPG
jgi:hypothetical protein